MTKQLTKNAAILFLALALVLASPATAQSVESYGPATGSNILSLTVAGPALINSQLSISTSNLEPYAAGYLLFSAAPSSLPVLGGHLLVDPAAMGAVQATAKAHGGHTLLAYIPGDAALVGVRFYVQSLFFDTRTGTGFSLSNGAKVTLGGELGGAQGDGLQ